MSVEVNLQCHLGVDDVEDGLDEIVLVAIKHIGQVSSNLYRLSVGNMDKTWSWSLALGTHKQLQSSR